jgi:hypothetical protein
MLLPTTIDEVLTALERIIADSKATEDRVGFFASLYHKVTAAVKEGIAKGDFQDGPRMARLDVLFANRYLSALDNWRNGEPVTESWKVALDATKNSSLLILQHLLLGINAHINLDLGIAAVETVGDQPIQSIHQDFDAINAIIGSLTYQVINEINQMSPLLSLMGLHANNTSSFLVQFSVGNARDGAWCFAEALSSLEGLDYGKCLQGRDKDVSTLAKALTTSSGFLKFTLWLIHLFERKNPARIIAVLGSYQKKFIKAREIGRG